MKTMLVCALLLGTRILSADVTGKWSGTINVRQEGEQKVLGVLLILKQEDGKVTGTAGGDERDRHAIQKGAVDGDAVTIEVAGDDDVIYLDLKIDGDQMTGDARKGDSPRMKISLKRVKD